jgi:uncharacterized delta-60 repeat protein
MRNPENHMRPIPSLITLNSKLGLGALILGMLAMTSLPQQVSAAQGDLDATFGGDGIAVTDFSANPDGATDVALQPDGKIVVAGFSQSGVDITTSDFALTRHNSDGTLDLSFGTNGKVTTDFAGSRDTAYDVAIQADGKVVVAGQSQNGTETDFALARYNSDGSLDTSFGTGGKVRSAFIDYAEAHEDTFGRAMDIQADGKIILAGKIYGTYRETAYDFALARYNIDGTLDTTFGSNGWVTTDFFFQPDEARSLVLQSDGTIIVGGWASISFGNNGGEDFALARYNSDGTLDTTFGPDGTGKVNTDFSASTDSIYSITLQPDGSIIAAGRTSLDSGVTNDFALARYSSDGIIDSTFGSDGKVTTVFSSGNDLAVAVVVQPDGLIIAGGYTTGAAGDLDCALVRYNPDGSLSQTFGEQGKVITAISTESDSFSGLVLQPDGKLVAAGGSGVNQAFVAARFLTAGAKSLNISTRADVGTGDNVLIGGFIITGTVPKTVILRAIGPSIPLGVMTAVLADPVLELHRPDGTVVTNDNWRDTQEQEIIDTNLPPTSDLESAIVATIDPSAYTVIVRGKDGGTGVALVEAYDLDGTALSQLANISTRGFVETDDNVMIGGFILSGSGGDSGTVVVRGIGPTLSDVGVANALNDPTLELHDADGLVVASNDDWKDSQEAEMEASGLQPTYDRESAILASLSAGAYTAILRGKDSATGVGLVEVYNLP